MSSTIKNSIIFVGIGVALILVYVFFIKKAPDQANLVSSTGEPISTINDPTQNSVANDFLNLLLSVKNIKLDDKIFTDPAFTNLRDSSITLTPDGTEGRVNPFASFGASDVVTTTPTTPTTPTSTR